MASSLRRNPFIGIPMGINKLPAIMKILLQHRLFLQSDKKNSLHRINKVLMQTL
ncbi:MAG: hypothetical protein JSS85_05730 [Bacteroidetes bacterium]|nr:hypothetical protein [Bacteroidota bacterium]